jgi:hypothetical protein
MIDKVIGDELIDSKYLFFIVKSFTVRIYGMNEKLKYNVKIN